jgi:hypothetical protein
MLVSLATALLIAAGGALRLRHGSTRAAALIVATAATVAVYVAWDRSLYTGGHLGTWYQWRSPAPVRPPTSANPTRG